MNKSGIQNSAFLKHSLKNFLIRLREYKKNFAANGVSELEDLITHVLEDPIVSYETIEKIITIKDSNEKVDIAILNFLTKLFRGNRFDFSTNEHLCTRRLCYSGADNDTAKEPPTWNRKDYYKHV